jgi:3-deoxy-D-manno-octulosonate 8-phosphate phosphatase (KDO 8-P phosphatase)
MPLAKMDSSLVKKMRGVKALVLDVDGVLTDGRIIFDDDGRELKFFHVRDGHGMKLLMRAGIEVIFLTGRTSRVVEHRAKDLGVGAVYQGARDKIAVLGKVLADRGLKPEQTACMGDDITDIPLFRVAGFSAAVADACEEARKAADFVTRSGGGRGAVREVCELILKAQDKWREVTGKYELP